jgi:hypothetical protein
LIEQMLIQAGRALAEAAARGRNCLGLDELPPSTRAALKRAGGLPGTRLSDGMLCVESPMELALFLLRGGVSEKVVASILDWRMFEEYAAWVLGEAGFRVWRGIRLHGAGGFQVDVLGIDTYGHGIVVECKHWSPRASTHSKLRAAAVRHLERTRNLARFWHRLGLPHGGYRLVPALLVLREAGLPRLVEGVPVVPVSRLRGFIEELDYIMEDPRVVKIAVGGLGEPR